MPAIWHDLRVCIYKLEDYTFTPVTPFTRLLFTELRNRINSVPVPGVNGNFRNKEITRRRARRLKLPDRSTRYNYFLLNLESEDALVIRKSIISVTKIRPNFRPRSRETFALRSRIVGDFLFEKKEKKKKKEKKEEEEEETADDP